MKNNIRSIKNEITPVRLHLELKDDYLTDYQRRMLRRYGESISGDSITRDMDATIKNCPCRKGNDLQVAG